MANLQLAAAGDVGALEDAAAELAVEGARRNLAAELPAEAESLRHEIRAVVGRVAATPAAEQRAAMAEAGLIMPHWPAPWGRGASPSNSSSSTRSWRRPASCGRTSPWVPGHCRR